MSKTMRVIAMLRCLVPMDTASAEQILIHTVPPGNILYAIERLVQTSKISAEKKGKQAMFQFVVSGGRDGNCRL